MFRGVKSTSGGQVVFAFDAGRDLLVELMGPGVTIFVLGGSALE